MFARACLLILLIACLLDEILIFLGDETALSFLCFDCSVFNRTTPAVVPLRENICENVAREVVNLDFVYIDLDLSIYWIVFV